MRTREKKEKKKSEVSLELAPVEEGCKIKSAAYPNRPQSRCMLTGRDLS